MFHYLKCIYQVLLRLEQLCSQLIVLLSALKAKEEEEQEANSILLKPEEWMDRQQLMTYLKISKSTVRRLKIKNELKCCILGGKEYFFKKDVERALRISIKKGKI